MMERNEESLSTRDLASPTETATASPNEPATGEPNEEARVSSNEDPTASPHEARDRETAGETRSGQASGEAPIGQASGDTTIAQISGEEAAPVDDNGDWSQADRRDNAPASDGKSEADTSQADQAGRAASPAGTAGRASGCAAPLLPADLTATFQDRWEEVQTRFVDEPRGAVEEADRLVANLMQKLAESFAQERERLEAQWGRGEDISTEDLRVSLQRYRSFFQRLLAT